MLENSFLFRTIIWQRPCQLPLCLGVKSSGFPLSCFDVVGARDSVGISALCGTDHLQVLQTVSRLTKLHIFINIFIGVWFCGFFSLTALVLFVFFCVCVLGFFCCLEFLFFLSDYDVWIFLWYLKMQVHIFVSNLNPVLLVSSP